MTRTRAQHTALYAASQLKAVAQAVLPRGPYKSKLEESYSRYLTLQVRAGEILEWQYESVTLTLAPCTDDGLKGCRFTPDFVVRAYSNPRREGTHIELHECKGRSRPDFEIKWKWARKQFAGLFVFKMVRWQQNSWVVE
jgi:hypothetical protein